VKSHPYQSTRFACFTSRNVCNYKSKNAQHTHLHEGRELLKASYTSRLGLKLLLVYEAFSYTEHTHLLRPHTLVF
jgi:hypothetical protein